MEKLYTKKLGLRESKNRSTDVNASLGTTKLFICYYLCALEEVC